MRVSVLLILFLILFNTSICFSSVNIEDEIKSLEKRLYELQSDLKKKNKLLQELKKILILTIIKEKMNTKNFLSLNSEKNYYQIRDKHEFYVLFYHNIEKKIKETQIKINNLKEEYERKLKKLKEIKYQYAEVITTQKEVPKGSLSKGQTKDYIIDPITEEAIGPGRYKKSLRPGVLIKAPHAGIVKKISFTADTFALSLEGPKCSSTIIGISVLKVSIGEEVKAGQILGESGFSQDKNNLFYEIECKKQISVQSDSLP